MVIERALSRNTIVQDVKEATVLIWDEVSLSSRRVFKLVSTIQHQLSDNNFAFGAIHVILVGDFWQLQPIPSGLDAGKPVYESSIFNDTFSDRFELKNVLRQSKTDYQVKEVLDLLRIGQCTEEAERKGTSKVCPENFLRQDYVSIPYIFTSKSY